MYFYCKHCGWLSDTLPENYLFRPSCCCAQCKGIIDSGWLDEAKEQIIDSTFQELDRKFND